MNRPIKVMLIDDDPGIHESLRAVIEEAGYEFCGALGGREGLRLLDDERPDLLLLDVMMPGMNGFDVCQQMREEGRRIPVIFLTAKNDIVDKSTGFKAGADDYVTKPFSIPVLLQKIRAVLRRTTGHAGDEPICYRNLTLDLEGYQAYLGGTPVDLTRREIALLRTLLENQGRVLTRQMLLNRVWSYDFYGDERIVDTHIKNLRKKLEADYIETVRGVGYRMERENKT